ncbi:MAG: lytic transglycosylase domain-containing protein [Acidobacteriota bacterium]|nr:lytic transglycosylase domain-containing protein [Acidobacteriota bacterium]
MFAVPTFAASPEAGASRHMTTVVRADSATGRLVRSVVLEQRVAAPHPSVQGPVQSASLHDVIDRIADEQGVETGLVHSVIRAESNYNANAVSPKGALGIMQLIPATAHRFGVSDALNPVDNIRGGVRYLRFLLDYYRGDYPKTIAAYNAGEAAVDKYNGIPPYSETRNYVERVAKNLNAARLKAANPVELAQQTAPDSETPKSIQTSTGSDGRVYYRTP